jgi:hypothetical protein
MAGKGAKPEHPQHPRARSNVWLLLLLLLK